MSMVTAYALFNMAHIIHCFLQFDDKNINQHLLLILLFINN
ncbi:hypothetical protein PE36_07602 [Moritella sp. PE36]|nr:hypothetical protein PE36_07602 [Moritella sp. PE36]